MFSFHWDRAILRFSFEKISQSFSNHPSLKATEVHNCRNIKNRLKLNDWKTPVLFCKYLCNESSDLHEILCGGRTYDHKIVIYHHIKFHEDPSFCCGDICKTILVFFNHWFSMYFWYFGNYAPPKPSKMDDYWMIVEFFQN